MNQKFKYADIVELNEHAELIVPYTDNNFGEVSSSANKLPSIYDGPIIKKLIIKCNEKHRVMGLKDSDIKLIINDITIYVNPVYFKLSPKYTNFLSKLKEIK